MSTAQLIIDQVNRILIDEDDAAYSDSLMIGYLNEAITRFATETHCNQVLIDKTITTEKVTFAELLAEAEVSSIGSAVIFVAKVLLSDGTNYNDLPKAPLAETKSKLASTATAPTRWSEFAETVFLDLAPGKTGLSNALQLVVSYIPTLITAGTETVRIPIQWHPALVKYVTFCCRQGDRDAGLATGAFQEYELIRSKATEFYQAMLG